jgi:hypothetical protein
MLTEYVNKIVTFTKRAEDLEAYPEEGMRARIVSIRGDGIHKDDIEDHIYIVTVDYSEFDEFNKTFESSDYYDKNGSPCLTARQAGFYTVQEDLYFPSPKVVAFEKYFTITEADRIDLIRQFKESGAVNYVGWLETRLLDSVATSAAKTTTNEPETP